MTPEVKLLLAVIIIACLLLLALEVHLHGDHE